MNAAVKQNSPVAVAPKCATCASKSPMLRLAHHMRGFRSEDDLKTHLVEQYGPRYEMDGRLQRRLKMIAETRRLFFRSAETMMPMSLAEAYAIAVRNNQSLKSGTELAAPRE